MSRRRPAVPRIIAPDSRYASVELARFINRVMQRGKKTTAQRLVYAALDLVRDESHSSIHGIELRASPLRPL